MQIYFHSHLWSYLPRVPILVEDSVYIYIYIYIYTNIACVCIYIYIIYTVHTHILCKQKRLFWMR